MKRDLVLRNLHMGCGEGLVGRVRRASTDSARVPVVRRNKMTGRSADKGKR